MSSDGEMGWRVRMELRLAYIIKKYHQYFPVKLMDYCPKEAERFDFGSAAPNERGIPKIIWAYWSGVPMPEVVKRCVAGWRRMHPGWKIEVLDDERARALCDQWPDGLLNASVQKQSDWLRLELLRKYGGVWLDASTILTRPLDWILEEQRVSKCDFVGFYLERFTRNPRSPVIENWFMAAPAGSPLIVDSQNIFARNIVESGVHSYLEALKGDGRFDGLVQGIDDPVYLSFHVALQDTLQRSDSRYRVSLWKAEDTAFLYQAQAHWNRGVLKHHLFMRQINHAPAPIVKLRGPDRRKFDLYLENKLWVPGSLVDRYVGE